MRYKYIAISLKCQALKSMAALSFLVLCDDARWHAGSVGTDRNCLASRSLRMQVVPSSSMRLQLIASCKCMLPRQARSTNRHRQLAATRLRAFLLRLLVWVVVTVRSAIKAMTQINQWTSTSQPQLPRQFKLTCVQATFGNSMQSESVHAGQ